MSKRQLARNERDLQDLIVSVSGNDRCADCQARNPGSVTTSNLLAEADCNKRMGELECKFSISALSTALHVDGRSEAMLLRRSTGRQLTLHELQLGIFLCMRCAALHRKLGTHISKVKSLSMDTWSTEQVEVFTKSERGCCDAYSVSVEYATEW